MAKLLWAPTSTSSISFRMEFRDLGSEWVHCIAPNKFTCATSKSSHRNIIRNHASHTDKVLINMHCIRDSRMSLCVCVWHGTISDRRTQKHKLHAPKYRICVYLNTYILNAHIRTRGGRGWGRYVRNEWEKRTAIKPTNNNSNNNNNNTRNDCQNALRRHQHRQNTEFRILLHYTPEHYKSKASFIENIESAERERERERDGDGDERQNERRKHPTGGLIFISFFIDGLLIPNSADAVAVAAGCWWWWWCCCHRSKSLLNFRSCLVSFYPYTIQPTYTHVSHVIQNESIHTIKFRGENIAMHEAQSAQNPHNSQTQTETNSPRAIGKSLSRKFVINNHNRANARESERKINTLRAWILFTSILENFYDKYIHWISLFAYYSSFLMKSRIKYIYMSYKCTFRSNLISSRLHANTVLDTRHWQWVHGVDERSNACGMFRFSGRDIVCRGAEYVSHRFLSTRK